jgi:hypothetical protein
MDLADAYRDPETSAEVQRLLGVSAGERVPRADVVRQIIERDDRKFLEDLTRNNRVKIFAFSDDVTPLSTVRAQRERPAEDAVQNSDPPTVSGPEQAEFPTLMMGPATNVDRALRRAVETMAGSPIAAVVVVSDGGFNQGGSAEEAARFARERGIAVHTVGIGDPSPPRNVRVSEIFAPENAFQQDPFPVTARIVAEGLEGLTLSVQLREQSVTEGGEGRVVAAKSIGPIRSGETLLEPVAFQHRQSRAGRYVYSVEVPVVEAESVADDNSKQTSVHVVESRTKALVVAGFPTWDYIYVSRLLQRDDTFDVSCWLQSADVSAVRDGDVIIDHLPVTAEELFNYDVVILMDPDPAELNEEWCDLADRFVTEHGGGLLFTAARRRTPELMREPALKNLRDLLPVTLDPDADIVLNRIGYYQSKGFPVEIPEPSFAHPVMRLADDATGTKLAWQGIGEVYWHYPVLREKPAATVLMRHGDERMRNSYGPHVLSAFHFVGAGRAAFLGIDGTFRWRRHGEVVFDRFWVQFIRYLAESKQLGGSRRGTLLTDKDQVAVGEAVTVTARLFDVRFEPLVRPEVEAEYSVEGERTPFILTPRSDRAGWYEGRFVPDRVGTFRVHMRVPNGGGSGSPGSALDDSFELVREVRVSRPNLEMLHPQMDRAALRTLAERSAGGRYFSVGEVSTLPDLIPDLHEEVSIRSSPTSLWDRPPLLALFVGLLALEWAIRKWHHLL